MTSPLRLALFGMTVGLVALFFPSSIALAQGNRQPKPTLHVQEMIAASRNGESSSASGSILQRRENYSPAAIDSLITGLEQNVFEGATPFARMSAAGALASAGAASNPLPGTVARLTSIYSRSNDDLVKRIIVSKMNIQTDKPSAVAFLKAVANERSDSQDFTNASWLAVSVLASMGNVGKVALSDLRKAESVTDGRARGYIEWFFSKR